MGSLDAKTRDGRIGFQAALFIFFQKPLLPFLFPSSLPLATPLSSLTQVGRESGTSRWRRLMLYTGANYPLLGGGRVGATKSGAKKGRGKERQDWGRNSF